MKYLKTLLISGIIATAAPQVVESNLMEITAISSYSLYLKWDLNNDGREDLRVFYTYRDVPHGLVISKPHRYHQDLNNDGRYDESEMFMFNGK